MTATAGAASGRGWRAGAAAGPGRSPWSAFPVQVIAPVLWIPARQAVAIRRRCGVGVGDSGGRLAQVAHRPAAPNCGRVPRSGDGLVERARRESGDHLRPLRGPHVVDAQHAAVQIVAGLVGADERQLVSGVEAAQEIRLLQARYRERNPEHPA